MEKHSENYWITVLLYFASFLIGLGIIAVIAANWWQIPDVIKLAGALLSMLVNTLCLLATIKWNKPILKQVVACIYAFLIMGVIGLIGQVFHLNGNIHNACLLWSCISWPLILVAPRLLWLWIPVYFIGNNYIFDYVHYRIIGFSDFGYWLHYCSVFAVFCAYTYCRIYPQKVDKSVFTPLFLYSALLMLGAYCGIADRVVSGNSVYLLATQTYRDIAEYIAPYMFMAVFLGYFNFHKHRMSFMPLFLIGTAVEFWVALMLKIFYRSSSDIEIFLPIVFLLLTLGYTIYHKKQRAKIMTVFMIIVWCSSVLQEDIFDLLPFLSACVISALLAYRAQSRKWFNVSVLAAVLRILIYYADVDDLQYMGFYLIGSGVLMLATILLLVKYNPLRKELNHEK